MKTSREIRLASRPTGLPTAANFELASVDVPAPGPGEVLVRNLWMTVDPYMRGRMNDAKSYTPPFALGEALVGGAVGEVVESNAPGLAPGDVVESFLGWREGFSAPADAVKRVDTLGLPVEALLGAAGMPGLTAYVGLLRIAGLKPGDVVFVSGAAGAVGSMVCQIAKLKGHKVIASAGGAEKVAFLRDELRVDAVIDYKADGDLTAALARAAPDGIDVYFENVGGEHLEAAIANARPFGRFALCGMISQYNATSLPAGPRNVMQLVGKSLRLEGFIVSNHNDLREAFLRDFADWHAAGQITWRQTVFEGLERAPDAFVGLFKGENFGKMLVKLS